MDDVSDQSGKYSWPDFQPNARRNVFYGLLALVASVACYWYLYVGGAFSPQLSLTIIVCATILTRTFTIMGESLIEDCVKSALVLILGCLFLPLFPASWCLAPGLSAIIATIINATIQSTIGRHY